ncbi:MAG: hypothetical protein HN778_06420 [Prolixibacteraceae bacterium]|jgi:hypothetical protein|nr:hypothetical protein [Prolixibacteraceae bacterium]MBT6006233.1 hypothetical protein [Prolixibacteraceae bacterium]MBT6766369.1 hypothetical protein [Prolixibacteraceae bacterium]MBT6999051.1 hypothetical protein [Prolixibacteraceae bacterium]MBT7394450.1 hypothetical protein [Prolixibacteraceae bacterium]
MKYLLFVLILSLVFITGCSEDNNLVEMDIVETGCMNPWDRFYTETDNYFEEIKEYLGSEGIWVKHVSSQQYYYIGPGCEACFCPTGNLIIIQIKDTDIGKAEEIGFSLIRNGKLNIPTSN